MDALILIMGAWVTVAVALGIRRARPDPHAALELRARLEALYGQPHVYREVELTRFPEVDHRLYHQLRGELEGQGFRYLADLEDATLREAYPDNRAVVRVFVDKGALIRASAYHVHPRGVVVSLLELVALLPRHVFLLELVTEVGGKFLVTANAKGLDRLETPAEALIDRLPVRTRPRELIAHHQARLTQLIKQAPSRVPVAMAELRDVQESLHRAHVLMAKHRKRMGMLSQEELERLKGRPLSPHELAFLQEVQQAGPSDG